MTTAAEHLETLGRIEGRGQTVRNIHAAVGNWLTLDLPPGMYASLENLLLEAETELMELDGAAAVVARLAAEADAAERKASS